MKQAAIVIKVALPRVLRRRFQVELNQKRLVHARSTWSVTAVTCNLDFVGTSMLAQLTAVLIVRLASHLQEGCAHFFVSILP